MARLQTILARIACVVMIVPCAYRGLLGNSADWPTRMVGIVLSCLFLLYLWFDVFGERMRHRFPFFSRFGRPSVSLVVDDERTEMYSAEGKKVFSVANRFVWQSGQNGRRVLAVGAPEEWSLSTPRPLPADAMYTDLGAEALPTTPCIDEQWEAFIYYCEMMGWKKAGVGFGRRLFHRLFSPLQVKLRISDPFRREFVGSLLRKSRHLGPLEVITRNEDELQARRA